MHFHLPKPLHGWRAFIGEVGVVVLGVVLALGAEQTAEAIKDRVDEAALEETINHEIASDLFMYDLRSRQFACDQRRVDELREWLNRARKGDKVPPLFPVAPQGIAPYRSGWDTRDADVFNHLSATRRQKYAEFFDDLAFNWSLMQAEQEYWQRLLPYAEAGAIDLSDRRAVLPIVAEIDNVNVALEINVMTSRKIAQVLGVQEAQPDDVPSDWLQRVGVCPSVITAPS